MNFKKQAELILRLYRSTLSGALEWKDSPRDEVYQISFRDYTVRLGMRETGSGEPDYFLEVVSEGGAIMDAFTDVDLSMAKDLKSMPKFSDLNWYMLMEELYHTARRSVLGADKALDAILNELGTGSDAD